METVTLICDLGSREFEFSHAERLLSLPNNGGWKLPENSKYQFDENGLNIRPSKGKTQISKEESNYTSGDTARTEA